MLLQSFAIAGLILPLTTPVKSAQVPVVGFAIRDGENPPPRRNINDLFSEGGPEWDLLVLGLSSLQEQVETDDTSYFQIMGIHGLPHVAWNGAEQVPGGANGGYCPHNEVLFATWHRPFLVLYEQTLASHVERIAGEFPTESAVAYKAAAQRLRVPYWDWASDARLPEAISQPEITVNSPQGRHTLRNPFYSYRYQRSMRESGLNEGGLGRYNQTKRNPQDNGTEDYGTLNVRLMASNEVFKRQVYNVFSQTFTFENMATAKSSGSSFEDPHNTIHNMVGSGGHLQYLDWSAFDPAFALHHCNVDRLVALWQAVNYENAMFNSSMPTGPRFGSAAGVATADAPLKPFFASSREGDFHTSRTVADHTKFGYTYPELVGPQGEWLAPEDLKRLVVQRVNVLYGSPLSAGIVKKRRRRRDGLIIGRKLRAVERDVPGDSKGENNKKKNGNGKGRDYSVQIRVDRAEIDLPVVVEVYVLGRLAGEVALLGMPETGVSFSVVPLGKVLGELEEEGGDEGRFGGDFTEKEVLPVLEEDMELKVKKPDGTRISAETIPGLEVEVLSREYTPRKTDDEFPRFGAVHKVAINISPPAAVKS